MNKYIFTAYFHTIPPIEISVFASTVLIAENKVNSMAYEISINFIQADLEKIIYIF